MRLLAVLCLFGNARAYQSAVRPRVGLARSASPRCLDVVVPTPKAKKPEEGLRSPARGEHDETPDYMKSKRNMYPRKCDVMDEIEDFVQLQIDNGLLLDQEKAWQPVDFLPDSEQPTEQWFDEIREFREMSAELPDDLLLVLIGDMVRRAWLRDAAAAAARSRGGQAGVAGAKSVAA